MPKQTKLIYFGAKLAENESKLDAIGEYLETMGFPAMRGNDKKISHAAVIRFLIEASFNEIQSKAE